MIGLILTTYGDEIDEAIESLRSLDETRDYPSKVVVVSANAPVDADRRLKAGVPWLMDTIIHYEPISLTRALNEGIKHYQFNWDILYLGWIHPDMTFPEKWMASLVTRLEDNPLIGKIHPNNLRDGKRETEEPGNDTPWLIPMRVFSEVGLFDESFKWGGGKEDWDMNRRIVNAGYKVVISPVANIMHTAMQTRKREDTTSNEKMMKNYDVYFRKWGDHEPVV